MSAPVVDAVPSGASSPDPTRSSRQFVMALVALLLVMVLASTALVWQLNRGPEAPAGRGFETRMSAGTGQVADSRGEVWAAATGLTGGAEKQSDEQVEGTASPQVYQTYREGLWEWKVAVPGPGRYAVDLLLAELSGAAVGERVFSVIAEGGGEVQNLASDLDLAALPQGARRAHHVTGDVEVADRTLLLRFVPSVGMPVASALRVSWQGEAEPQVLLDEQFDGEQGADPSETWQRTQAGGPSGDGELQAYLDSAASASLDGEGNLAITARKEPFLYDGGSADYTSGKVTTEGRFSFTFGRVEARARVPEGRGLWPAFWAVGADRAQVDWPRSGEYDVMEVLGSQPETVHAYVHGLGDEQDPKGWRDQPVSSVGRDYETGTPLHEDWHDFAADVRPGAITFSLDGEPYFTAAEVDLRGGQAWPFEKPFYLILNVAVGGSWGGPPDGSTEFPATMLVDWVRVTS